ncbi:MAG: hypothetical protein KDB00_13155, partial [Planctomycetales bacterium]|nr:hypothetical protein [Planctomycetales bacterium]
KSALDRCVVALDLARASQYHDAERELAIVGQILGDCQWILNSRQSLAELHRLDASLLSGPLGLLDQVASTIAQPVVNQQTPLSLDKRFGRSDDHLHASGRIDHLLTVDGVGAILLIQSNTVSIGCVSKSNQHDIPLQTQGPSSPVMIRRTGDDYFAESEIEFRVNDHPTLRRLLVAGDSIGFGRRGRLRFRKPVPASGSAVLQLTGAGLSRQDIRHVALMADSLLFSNGGGHFSVANCERPIVVFSQPGGYAIKYAGSGGEVGKLELGQSQLLGQTRFTLNQINLSNSSGEK